MRPLALVCLILIPLLDGAVARAGSSCLPWQPVPVPGVAGASRVYLFDVAAIAHDDAWAVGEWRTSDGATHNLAMHWDGTSWTEVPVPDPIPYSGGKSQNALHAVVARGPDDVWAAGYKTVVAPWSTVGQQTMVLHWDGSSWSEVSAPLTAPNTSGAQIQAIELVGQTLWFAGNDTAPLYSPALAMTYDGAGFTKTAAPVTNTDGNTLNDISAVAADDIWAVGAGNVYNPTIGRYLCHWDGHQWSHVDSPKPGIVHEFKAVAAIATDDVWATGAMLQNSGGYTTLFMHWDGTAWSGPVPNTGGGSCLLGLAWDDVYTGGLGIHHFNGTAWQVCEMFPSYVNAAIRGFDRAPDGALFAVGFHNGTSALPFAALAQETPKGCAGSGGVVPEMSLNGAPMAGNPITLSVSGGLGGSSALVLFGLQGGLDLPIGASGCSLYISPLLPVVLTLPLGGAGPGTGDSTLFGVIPQGASGATIFLQALVIDPGVPAGFSATNELELSVP